MFDYYPTKKEKTSSRNKMKASTLFGVLALTGVIAAPFYAQKHLGPQKQPVDPSYVSDAAQRNSLAIKSIPASNPHKIDTLKQMQGDYEELGRQYQPMPIGKIAVDKVVMASDNQGYYEVIINTVDGTRTGKLAGINVRSITAPEGKEAEFAFNGSMYNTNAGNSGTKWHIEAYYPAKDGFDHVKLDDNMTETQATAFQSQMNHMVIAATSGTPVSKVAIPSALQG